MCDAVSERLAGLEDRSWWHESRRDLVRAFLRKVRLPEQAAALDVGCGTGGSLQLLSEFASRVVGLDVSPHRIEIARRKFPAAELGPGDANALAQYFENETFDLVTFFNVLYHERIEDEVAVLRQARGVLQPGGVVVVTEPAFQCLYRRQDRLSRGKRRYTLSQMRELLERAGLEWIAGTYFNMVSFLPAWLLGVWDRFHPNGDVDAPLAEMAVPPFPFNEGMKLLMALERAATRIFGRLPLGVTLLGLGRRPIRTETEPVVEAPDSIECKPSLLNRVATGGVC